MKIKQLFFTCMALGFALSCSQDKLEEQQTDGSKSALVQQYDQSNLGIYKGVFTTADGMQRGVVSISLSNDNAGSAQIKLSSGEIIEMMSSKVKADTDINNLHFYTNSLLFGQTSFEFSVERNGNNPAVGNVQFDSKASDVLIAKETSARPLAPLTGTYDCDNCATLYPQFGNGPHTFNIMSIGQGDQNFATQVSFRGGVYNSAAANNTQSNCVIGSSDTFDVCDIDGTSTVSGKPLVWTGSHTYAYGDGFDCSDASGTWSLALRPGSTLTGTFTSDSDCSPQAVPNDLCSGAIAVTCNSSVSGTTFGATSTDAPTDCDDTLGDAPGVWHVVTGIDGLMTFDTFGSAIEDTKLAIFGGECGDLTCIASNDDAGTGFQSELVIAAVSGESLYVYITGYGATNFGNYTLNVSCDPYLTCGDQLIDDGGIAGNYAVDTTTFYVIDAGEGNSASLTFSVFQVEDFYDEMLIFDGLGTGGALLSADSGAPATGQNGGYTGTELSGESVTGSGRYLTVAFISDIIFADIGFVADITCTPDGGRSATSVSKMDRNTKFELSNIRSERAGVKTVQKKK